MVGDCVRFDGSVEVHRRKAYALGWKWAAAYIAIDHTRDPEAVSVGFGWFDNPNDDRLNEAFDQGLSDGLARMPLSEARRWLKVA